MEGTLLLDPRSSIDNELGLQGVIVAEGRLAMPPVQVRLYQKGHRDCFLHATTSWLNYNFFPDKVRSPLPLLLKLAISVMIVAAN